MTDTDPYAHISHRQDDFSGAYIRAICAVTGCGIERISLDNDKVDYTLSSRVRGKIKSKPKIDIQAKCQRIEFSDEPISYSLDIDTYNNLRDPLLTNPRILVLVRVPAEIDDWTIQSHGSLVLKHCAYWLSLRGEPDVPNQSAKTVYFPRENMFTPEALRAMMVDTSEGRDLS